MTFPYSRKWVEDVLRGVKRHQQGLMFQVERIPEKVFIVANEQQRKLLLRTQFERLTTGAGVNLRENVLCPYHNDQNPSMTYYPDTKKFFCHARCFEKEVVLKDGSKKNTSHKDAFDLVGDLFELTSFDETYNTLVSWFVENPKQFFQSRQPYRKSSETKKKLGSAAPKSTRRVLATTDPEIKAYLNGRGIDDNMIVLFKIGACEEDGIKLATVPCDNGFEARRNIRFKPKNEGDTTGKYLNPKGRSVDLFNGRELKIATADMPVIVVESAFDAMLIRSMGIPAVATNGPSTTKLVNHCKSLANKDLRLILLFDFDDAGKRATNRAYSQLRDSVKCVAVTKSNPILATYLADLKDVGEAYQADKNETEKALRWLVEVVHFD